jgi:hypothetical protein
LIGELLAQTIRTNYLKQLLSLPPPLVSVHIRRGDFRTLKPDENFASVGNVRTPDCYFHKVLTDLRSAAGYQVPITVFSDGTPDELRFIMDLPDVNLSPAPNDVVDLLLLARSRVIICSAASTFSEWAGYLSNAVILRHPQHIHSPIRSSDLRTTHYEGATPNSPEEWSELWQARLHAAIEGNVQVPGFISAAGQAHQPLGRAR